jgi:hypothetical protein
MALTYYDVSGVIAVSQPVELDPESVLYQSEDIWKKYKRLSRKITVLCVGPGILYVRTSHDGTYFSEETVIYEGQSKDFDEIYVLKLRSPSANLRYRVSEYNVNTVSGQQFSGSRFKDRRDRDGVIVFQDDYESPTLKFQKFIYPPGSPWVIVRTNATAYAGDFSIGTLPGSNIGDTAGLAYVHPDFHVGKIASQIHFASDFGTSVCDINLEIDYYDGKNLHSAFAAFTTDGNLLIAIPVPGAPPGTSVEIQIPIAITIFPSSVSWNVFKLAIDISAFKYVAIFVNGERVDLSGFDLVTSPDTSSKHILSLVENTTRFNNEEQLVFFDNYIFTEDETFT